MKDKGGKTMNKEMKKDKGICRIAGRVIFFMATIVVLTACTGRYDKTTQGDLELDADLTEDLTKDLTEEQDGIGEEYKTMSFQVPTDQVISAYHEKGYGTVWLISHEVENINGEIGEIGTTDSINLRVTYADPNGYFSVTQDVSAIYAWWGEEIGWKNNYDMAMTLVSCDMTGFNGTYWKLASDSDIESAGYAFSNYDIALSLLGEDIMKQYDNHSSTVSIYFALENFEVFSPEIEDLRYFDEINFCGDILGENKAGTIHVVVEGDVYSVPLRLKYKSGGYDSKLLIAQGARFYLCGATQYDTCKIFYSVDGGSNMIPMSIEEYKKAISGKKRKKLQDMEKP